MRAMPKARGEHGGAVGSLIALVCLSALCALVYFARHPILRYAAESWIINEPAAHADAIIVLGDDNFYGDRATRATELYREGTAPVVAACGRRLRPSAGMSELIAHDLVERGVPKEKVLRFDHDAGTTVEEAEAVAKFVEGQHWKSVVIATSNYHTRRVLYIYRKVLPAGVSVSVAGARDGEFDPERWWEKTKSVHLFGHEILGMAAAMWELRGVGEKGKEAALFWKVRLGRWSEG